MVESFRALARGYKLLEYEFLEVLGQGGFGITYLAIDLNLNKKVAIKEYFPREFAARDGGQTIHPSGNSSDRDTFQWGLTRFLDEARTLALFDDPNIVSVKRFFEANGTAYLVMEYCEGLSLDELIKQGGSLDELKLLSIFTPLLASLEKIHAANFLHRDIKPSNIYIRKDGSPVLLDFGSARQHVSSHSRTVTSLATAGYAALEQYSASSNQGPETDIYGLAATLYRALTCERPQDSLDRVLQDNLVPLAERLAGQYSPRLLSGIDKAMALRPENRPSSIPEWMSILKPLQGQPSIDFKNNNVRKSTQKPQKKIKNNYFLAASISMLGVFFGYQIITGSKNDSIVSNVTPTQQPNNSAPPKVIPSSESRAVSTPIPLDLSKYKSRLDDIDSTPTNKLVTLWNGESISSRAVKQVNLGWQIIEAKDSIYYRLALKLNVDAFSLGHAEGASNVGYMHEYGLGTPVNYKVAADWYKKAIDSKWPHSPQAEIQLAKLYQNGRLGPSDKDWATEYYLQAIKIANNGNWPASKERNIKIIQDGLNQIAEKNNVKKDNTSPIAKTSIPGILIGHVSRVAPYSGVSYAELRAANSPEFFIGQDLIINGANYRVVKTYANFASVLRVDALPIPPNIVGMPVYTVSN